MYARQMYFVHIISVILNLYGRDCLCHSVEKGDCTVQSGESQRRWAPRGTRYMWHPPSPRHLSSAPRNPAKVAAALLRPRHVRKSLVLALSLLSLWACRSKKDGRRFGGAWKASCRSPLSRPPTPQCCVRVTTQSLSLLSSTPRCQVLNFPRQCKTSRKPWGRQQHFENRNL